MARKKIIRQNQFPYHVYIRTNNRTWFEIPMHQMWDLSYECLIYALKKRPVSLHAFVLMSNHYHMIVSTPDANLDQFMEFFNRKLSQRINELSRFKNHKFSNGYKWTIIDSSNYLYSIYRYVYQNPVKANLCQLCFDYPYSSLRFSPSQIKDLNLRPHLNYFKYRSWFEEDQSGEVNKTIGNGLTKTYFKIAKKTRVNTRNCVESSPLNS